MQAFSWQTEYEFLSFLCISEHSLLYHNIFLHGWGKMKMAAYAISPV